MNTLTEWKARLQHGTQIEQIWNHREGDVHHIFTITQTQTNGLWGTCPDFSHSQRIWMNFPKRSEIVFTDKGWIRLEKDRKVSEYIWVEQAS